MNNCYRLAFALLVLVPHGSLAATLEFSVPDSYVDIDSSAEVPVLVRAINAAPGEMLEVAAVDFLMQLNQNDACIFVAIDGVVPGADAPEFFIQSNTSPCYRVTAAAIGVEPLLVGTDPLEIARISLRHLGTGTVEMLLFSLAAYDLAFQPHPVVAQHGTLDVGCDKGDTIRGDGITSADALLVLLASVDLYDPSPVEFCAADHDSDGTITQGDAVRVLRVGVGLPPSKNTPSIATTTLGHGSSLSEVLIHVAGLAGAELHLAFDPSELSFLGLRDRPAGSLTVVNDRLNGLLVIGLASTESVDGELVLDFEITSGPASIDMISFAAFSEAGASVAGVVGNPTLVLMEDPTSAPTLPSESVVFRGATPNPFNPSTRLVFEVAGPGPVLTDVFDLRGRLIRRLEVVSAGEGQLGVRWDGLDQAGRAVPSGVYAIRVRHGGSHDLGRVVLLK